MAGKYAIVLTDTGNIPTVNGMVNAVKYYGVQAEIHIIHSYEKNIGNEMIGMYKNDSIVKLINLSEVRNMFSDKIPERKKRYSKVWLCKFLRYYYGANTLYDYDAVMNVDSDSLIINDITEFFDRASKSGNVIAVNNILSYRQPHNTGMEYVQIEKPVGASSPPVHSTHMFYKPSVCKEAFNEIIWLARKYPSGDMVAANRALIKHGILKDSEVLDNFLFIQTDIGAKEISEHFINGKRYLKANDELMYMTHRKWWIDSMRHKFILGKIGKGAYSQTRNDNVKKVHSIMKFLNTELEYKLWLDGWEWMDISPDVIQKYADSRAGWVKIHGKKKRVT